MADPNVTYKAGFLALQEKLGRVPRVSDPEWLELGNRYSASYSEEREARISEERKSGREAGREGTTVVNNESPIQPSRVRPGAVTGPTDSATTRGGNSHRAGTEDLAAAGRPGQESPSRKPAPQAYSYQARESAEESREALSGSRINDPGAGAESVLFAPVSPPGNCDGLQEGDRGPSGGLIGKCEACGRLWERPARRGRPAYKCEECR